MAWARGGGHPRRRHRSSGDYIPVRCRVDRPQLGCDGLGFALRGVEEAREDLAPVFRGEDLRQLGGAAREAFLRDALWRR